MESIINKVLQAIQVSRNIDLWGYHNSLLNEKIQKRIDLLGLKNLAEYLNRLYSDEMESHTLIEEILIKVSNFFRNPIVFEIIGQNILPQIIESKINTGNHEIRVWSAGCASGEEPYSIAILINDLLENNINNFTPFIFATDISDEALKTAASGLFPKKSLMDTKLRIIERYFTKTSTGFKIDPIIQNMVKFSNDDLTSVKRFAPSESIFGTFDLILCRNVLIYFDDKLQDIVLEKLYRALNKGGFLILGDCEFITEKISQNLVKIDNRNRIFQKPL
ncbi:MAG: protein-glutamate O-methyltransferase CheR [Desulfobacterales bacterium]|nr:protein-glutamate O-methyltransferase CheR [Desulfobacterales bacterium]